jgi:GDP-L-fucose synthase
MKKILILGGYGFMGKNLNKVFANSSYEIYNESRRTDCDILDYGKLVKKLQTINPDIVINAAAHVGSIAYVSSNSADVCYDNTQMYLNIFKAINFTNNNIILINPISNCSYPGIIDIQHEELWWDGIIHSSVESYGNPKKIGYILSECFRKQYGIKTINLILPNAYGPFDYIDEQRTHAMNGIVMRMIKAKKNKDQKFVVWGTGTPIREWIYMEDAANVIKLIIDNNLIDLPNPLNIGQQEGVSINESVSFIKDALQLNIEVENDITKQDGAPVKILGNILFKQYFPKFIFTSYQIGIENTINYYKNIL